MNSVIIPHLPGYTPGAYHHKAAAGYGYGIPAQGYLSYTPTTTTTTQQKHYGFHQRPQPTTPTDVFSVAAAAAAAAMMQPRPQYFQQKRQFEFPANPSTFPGKSQQYQQSPPRYQPYPAAAATATPPPAAVNRAPDVRTTSSTRPNRTKSEVCKPLFVDCSIEYDLPNVPKISAGKDGKVEPILMIHPAYLKQNQQAKRQSQSYPQPVVCNVRDCQCQMGVARQRQMLQQQQQQQQQQQLVRQQQQQVEATRKAVKRSYEANFQHQHTNMNAGKAKWGRSCSRVES